MREQQSGLGGHHPDDAHHLPSMRIEKNSAAAQAAAYRQAAYEAADQGYAGHYAGLHPENRPFQSTDLTPGSVKRARGSTNTPATIGHNEAYELEEDESYYTTRLPTSARRYPAYHVSPEHIVQRANQRLHVRYVDIPPRSSRPYDCHPGDHARDTQTSTREHHREGA